MSMDCTVIKSKSISAAKALERLDKFVQRNAASQADALLQQQAAQAAQEQGEEVDDSRAGAFVASHKINHISPDIYFQLTLMRDAMRKELSQQEGGK